MPVRVDLSPGSGPLPQRRYFKLTARQTPFPEPSRTYVSLADFLADGFTPEHEIYWSAVEAFWLAQVPLEIHRVGDPPDSLEDGPCSP